MRGGYKKMPKRMPPKSFERSKGDMMSDAGAAAKMPSPFRKKKATSVQSGGVGPGFSPAAYD